jgi:hypothetical protein
MKALLLLYLWIGFPLMIMRILPFTLVESRKKKNMRRKSSVSTSRPITRSQRNKKAESTNCALSPGKVNRTRSKPKKFQ